MLRATHRTCLITALTTTLLSAGLPLVSHAEENVDTLVQSLREQKDLLEKQRKELQEQQRAFEDQIRRFNELESKVRKITGANVGEAAANEKNGKKSDTPQHVGEARKPKEPEKAPEIAALVDQGGVLLHKGTLVVEPSFEYSNSSATRVGIQGFTIIPALNIGSFELTDVNRDTITNRVTMRYGLTNRLEVDMTVPYLFRNDQTKTRPFGVGSGSETLTEVDGSGLGDIEVGAHYQLTNGHNGWPFLVGNVRFKSTTGEGPFDIPIDPATGFQKELPTGSGFYALQPSITAIFPSDPVVFFGNIGYIFNFEDDIPGRGTINPGDSISASLGMGLSLNDKTSFSLSYAHSTVFETEQNGQTLPGSTVLQVGSLTFGASYKFSDRYGLNFTVDTGVTEDAPDVSLMFRVPITFNLLK
ncbi:MAG: transporter [Rickettsiales bacterium]|nr:transporter [Rickettsiales bacterium]